MDYEKAYKEALERAREFQKSKDGLCVLTAESIFPELKKSEDERLRKNTIAFLKDFADKGYENAVECIDWLEKQDEQKSKEEIKTIAYGLFGKYGAVEYVYILDYSTGRVIVAKHDVEENLETLFEKLGLKENQCHYMTSSDILSIEYINF